MKKPRVLLTGGGSGGHILPLLAVARELKDKAELRYFGPKDSYAYYFIGEEITVSFISGGKIRRYFSWRNFIDLPKFFWGLFLALTKILFFRPRAAFSKGGTGALPVILACRLYRIPIVIHESDAVPGLVNQLSASSAKVIETGFASAAQFFQNRKKSGSPVKINWTGNPLRPELLADRPEGAAAKKRFGFDSRKALILILGGSQGATALNDFVLNNLDGLLEKFQLLHQVGSQNYRDYEAQFRLVSKRLADYKKLHYQFSAYFEKNINEALAAADLIISRAGGGAVFEIASFGKPSILVPLPEAAQDHQRRNAAEYAAAGASLVIEENDLLGNLVIAELEKILSSRERYLTMSRAALAFAKPQAGAVIAKDILELIE